MSSFFLDSLNSPDDSSGADERFGGTNSTRAADRNIWLTLQAIRAHGPVTRVELAKQIGLTNPAISNIVNQLLKTELILKDGRIEGMRGQPAHKLVVNPDGAFSIGLNIDRDHLTLVVLDFNGEVRFRQSREVGFALPDVTVEFVRDQLALLRKSKVIDHRRIIGLGVALPDDLGVVKQPGQPADYSAWSSTDVQRLFSQAIGFPTYVENDAAAASIGEMHFGKGLKFDSFFYVLISSGLGGGLVIDRRYHRGAHGRSGELSFLPLVHPQDPEESDFERTVGDAFLVSDLMQRFRDAGMDLRHPMEIRADESRQSDILDDWIDRGVEYLGLPLLAMAYSVDPHAILVGGRLPEGVIDRMCDRLAGKMASYRNRLPLPPVTRADLAEDAPALGAAALAFNDRFIAHIRGILRLDA